MSKCVRFTKKNPRDLLTWEQESAAGRTLRKVANEVQMTVLGAIEVGTGDCSNDCFVFSH